MRLTKDIYLIGSGRLGMHLSDPLDCHVYAIDGGDEIAIIDAGLGRQPETLINHLRADGLDPRRVSLIVLTHAHADHAGGVAALRDLISARVVVPEEAAPWVEEANEVAISLVAARRAGLYPADFSWRPCTVHARVADGDVLGVGRHQLRAIETPGHSHGHCSYLLDGPDGRMLFAGDLVFFGGRVSLQNIWDCSIQELASSLEKLADLNVEALLPGHGLLTLRDGQGHIDRALNVMRELGVPRNLE